MLETDRMLDYAAARNRAKREEREQYIYQGTKEIVREVWEIRGLADKALLEGKIGSILEAKERMSLLNIKHNPESFAVCGHFDYGTDLEVVKEGRKSNWKHINDNLDAIYARVFNRDEVSVKFVGKDKFNSIVEWVWLLRAMWDDLLFKRTNGKIDELEARNTYLRIQQKLKDVTNGCHIAEEAWRAQKEIEEILKEMDACKAQIYRAEIDKKTFCDYMQDY